MKRQSAALRRVEAIAEKGSPCIFVCHEDRLRFDDLRAVVALAREAEGLRERIAMAVASLNDDGNNLNDCVCRALLALAPPSTTKPPKLSGVRNVRRPRSLGRVTR